jgi:hypothetical protein
MSPDELKLGNRGPRSTEQLLQLARSHRSLIYHGRRIGPRMCQPVGNDLDR